MQTVAGVNFSRTGASPVAIWESGEYPAKTQEHPARIAAKLSPPRSSSDGTAMNSAYSCGAPTPSVSLSETSVAASSGGRVASVVDLQATSMAYPRMAQVSFPSSRVEDFSMRGHNTNSSDTSARKRPFDALSPLPSPLLTFLSPALTSASAARSLSSSPPMAMNQFDLSSSRLGGINHSTPNQRDLQASAVGNNSLKFVVPSGIKRVRRDAPTSPCSVGEVNATATATASTSTSSNISRPSASPALPPVAPFTSSDKIRSVVRGLEHVSRCVPGGCGNPLCVSTRGFMNKVSAHLATMATKPGHVADRCGACRLWHSIVRSHASICMEVNCGIPLCATAHETSGTTESPANCRSRDRRDDEDDQRRSVVAQ